MSPPPFGHGVLIAITAIMGRMVLRDCPTSARFGHRIDHLAQLLAGKLKDNDLLSKSLLNELYLTAKVIRAEAQYIKGESTSLGEMADRIEMIFGLILRGESCDDRKPGVPRIV